MADPLWLIDLSILESPELTLRTWHFCCQGGVVLPPGAAAISRTTWKCQAMVHRLARGRVWCRNVQHVMWVMSKIWSCAKLSTSAMCNPSSEAATGGHTVCPLCGWHLCGLSKSKPLPFWLKEFLAQSAKGAPENMVIGRTDHLEEMIGIFWHKSQPNLGTQNRLVQICVPTMGHGFPHHTDLEQLHGSLRELRGTRLGITWHTTTKPTSCPRVAPLASLRNALEACPTIRHVEIIPGGHILRSSVTAPRACAVMSISWGSNGAIPVSKSIQDELPRSLLFMKLFQAFPAKIQVYGRARTSHREGFPPSPVGKLDFHWQAHKHRVWSGHAYHCHPALHNLTHTKWHTSTASNNKRPDVTLPAFLQSAGDSSLERR